MQTPPVHLDVLVAPAEEPAGSSAIVSPRGAVRWVCLLLLLVPWSIDAVRVSYQALATALNPVPTCLTELHIVHGIQQVAASKPLYPVVDPLALNYHFYNPLTYLPAGLAARWFPMDVDGLLVVGRVIPLVCTLGLLFAMGAYVRRRTGDWVAAAFCVAMVLFYHSSTLTDFFRNRPETPALLLTLAGWFVVQLRPKHWPYLAAVLFVAAVGFKQTFLAAPVACGLQLLWMRDGRNLARLTATCVALGLAMIAASYFFLGAGYFDHAVWAMRACPMDPIGGSLHFYPILVHGHWGMLFPAALVAAGWLAFTGRERNLLVYLLVCLILTTIAHGKQGADLNYHGELSLLMVLTVVLSLWHMFQARTVMAWCPLLLLLMGTWMPICSFGPGWNELSHERILRGPFAYDGPPVSQAKGRAPDYAAFRGKALILDDEIAVRVGQPTVYDWYALKILFEAGHLDFDVLQEAVRQHRFAVVVLKPEASDRWSRTLRETALASGYTVERRDDFLLELRPSAGVAKLDCRLGITASTCWIPGFKLPDCRDVERLRCPPCYGQIACFVLCLANPVHTRAVLI